MFFFTFLLEVNETKEDDYNMYTFAKTYTPNLRRRNNSS